MIQIISICIFNGQWPLPTRSVTAIDLIYIISSITIEAGKRSGKPCIRGMRITVYDILSYLAAGMEIKEILVDFPELTREDILACLAYAADVEKRSIVAL
jgi:uncharacterized protein (DUF433 family)